MNALHGIGSGEDAALATLLHPFVIGALAWPETASALFMRARDGIALREIARGRIVCEQNFKPYADALQLNGMQCVARVEGTFPLVALLMPRQRIEARAELARAVRRTQPGGTLVASATNNEGAKSHEADFRRLLGSAQSISKHHSRAFWACVHEESIDLPLLEEWLLLDAPRPVVDGRFISRPGVFAWDRIDAASELLAAHLPADLSGRGADLGAGFGYLSTEILARCAHVDSLDLYEADTRALELARTNVSRASAGRTAAAQLAFHWHDVTRGLPGRYDFIVTNPPFHVGRADQPELGLAFIAVAAEAMKPRGSLWLVANRHLPYEAALKERFASLRRIADDRGFKVIEAIKAAQ